MEALKAEGFTITATARSLGKAPTLICWKLKRSSDSKSPNFVTPTEAFVGKSFEENFALQG